MKEIKTNPLNRYNSENSILKSKSKIQMQVDGLLLLVAQEALKATTILITVVVATT